LKKRVQHVRDIERNQSIFELASKGSSKKRFKKENAINDDNDDEFLVGDYHSDDDQEDNLQNSSSRSHLSKEVRDLLEK
jgi:chromosome transmission fidelity protein 1